MSTPGQRAGGNGGVGWVDLNASVDSLGRSQARLLVQITIAVERLKEIAERGMTADAWEKLGPDDDVPVCPQHADPADCSCGDQQCPQCGHMQIPIGPCLNRECLTVIARAALDEMRRA